MDDAERGAVGAAAAVGIVERLAAFGGDEGREQGGQATARLREGRAQVLATYFLFNGYKIYNSVSLGFCC